LHHDATDQACRREGQRQRRFSHRGAYRAGENSAFEWLAKTIITNEEQIRHRRNEFVKLPNL
jgi:hypothetical protein